MTPNFGYYQFMNILVYLISIHTLFQYYFNHEYAIYSSEKHGLFWKNLQFHFHT